MRIPDAPLSIARQVNLTAQDASFFCTSTSLEGKPTTCDCTGSAKVDASTSFQITVAPGSDLYVLPCDENSVPSLNVWTLPDHAHFAKGWCTGWRLA
jgi:hypothetical protein